MTEDPGMTGDYARAVQLLDLVAEMTDSRKLKWKAREHRQNAYDVDLPSGNVEVGCEDNDGVSPFDFKIYEPAPQYGHIMTLSSRDNREVSRKISRLWLAVDGQVKGVTDKLDSLIRELREMQ